MKLFFMRSILISAFFSNQECIAQNIGTISECSFSNGYKITPCIVSYRTFGKLNEAKDNVVLISTWLLGRSEEWIPLIGPSGIVDTTRFYTIVVDALGNGRSQSPTNSKPEVRKGFDALTIGDMVQSQYKLLTEIFGFTRIHAVVGASMGGMQAFEWAVRYPSFITKVVSVIGSPRVGSYDRLLWTTLQGIIDHGLNYKLPADSIWLHLARIEVLNSRTPVGVNQYVPDSLMKEIRGFAKAYGSAWKLEDYRAQLGAMIRHDISANSGGDMKVAASRIKSKVLILYSWDDHMVTAGEGNVVGTLINAQLVEIPSLCGHLLFFCENEKVGSTIRKFLVE